MKQLFSVIFLFTLGVHLAFACINDKDTRLMERLRTPKLAEAILGVFPESSDDSARLRKTINELQKNPKKDDPAWWNDLAGAYLRLGKPDAAAKLLEPVLQRFNANYGIHANLGTAYHLLGRYKEAEGEIARDLEIDPDAHFGVEKYHLALLQYLCRDAQYQTRHVYVDEYTVPFLVSSDAMSSSTEKGLVPTNGYNPPLDPVTAARNFASVMTHLSGGPTAYQDFAELTLIAGSDPSPSYRTKWNLAEDPKLEEGLLYMASLNREQPACFVMLGMLCVQRDERHLAVAAYEKAIQLGSPQAPILKIKVEELREAIRKSDRNRRLRDPLTIFAAISTLVVVCWVTLRMALRKRRV